MLNAVSAAGSGLVLLLAFTIAQMHPYASANADRWFVVQAEEAGNAEVAEGRLAEMRGSLPVVHELGARMVRDHSRAGDELAAIARRQGLPVTSSPGADGYRELSVLRGLHGRAFDETYVRSNVPDHEKAIALLQGEVRNGRDPAVRDWARRTLPVLRLHLQLFRSALAQMHGR